MNTEPKLSPGTIEQINRMIERQYTKPVADTDLQIIWNEGGRYMVVQEWGTQSILMATFTGYVSERLTTEQITKLEDYYKKNRRPQW